MRQCFKIGSMALFAAVLCEAASPAPAAPRITSVVRVDARTGRLVRKIVAPRRAAPAVTSVKAAASAAAPADRIRSGIEALIEQTARAHDLDPHLVHSVAQVESNFNPYAVSPKGAAGVMQLIPSTARRFGVANTFDVKQNIEGGVRYLKYLRTLFPDNLRLALAAYNAGEGAVMKYGYAIPPYRETRDYVSKVSARYEARKAALAPTPAPAAVVAAAARISSEPRYSPIEHYTDAEGRLHIRTASAPGAETP